MSFRVKVFDGGIASGTRAMLGSLVESLSMYNVFVEIHEGSDDDGTDTCLVVTTAVPPTWAATPRPTPESAKDPAWINGFIQGYCARWSDT